MDENKQGTGKPTIDKEYLKKLAEKIKAEKAKKESMGRPADSGTTPPPPPIASITPKLLDDDDEEEDMAAEKTAIIDLAALSGHSADARLTILDGKDEGKSIDITREEIIAGRSLDNDFVISDISVSRKHFKVVRDGDHYAVADMGSGNGIKVNGSKTANATLYHGDVIIAGARQIRFEILNEEMKEKFSRKADKIEVSMEESPVKAKSSTLAWVAIFVVICGVGAGFYLFQKQAEQIESVKQEQQVFKLGIEDIDKIDEMIDKKDLKDAEKNVQFYLEKVPGNKQLTERLALIEKEKKVQADFEQGKMIFAQNKEDAEKVLKKIPEDSIFYEDVKTLVGPDIISKWAVDEIKALIAEKKEDDAMKKIYGVLIENPGNEEVKKIQMELTSKLGEDKVKKIQEKAAEEKKAIAEQKEKRLERRKIANANRPKPTPKPKPQPVDSGMADSGQASLDRAIELYLSKDFDSALGKLDDASQSSDKEISKKASLMKLELTKFKRQWTKSQKDKGSELRAGIDKLLKYDEKISGGQMSSDIQALSSSDSSSSEGKSRSAGKKLSDDKAKELYMQARSIKNENPEKAKELLNQIIDGTDSSSKYNGKAKDLLNGM